MKIAQIVAHLALADELVEGQRAQRALGHIALALRRIDDAAGAVAQPAAPCCAPWASSWRPARISASGAAAGPSRRAAAATAPNASPRRIAEIDQRRDRLGGGAVAGRSGRRPGGGERGRGAEAADLVLELVDDARGELRADALGARRPVRSWAKIARLSSSGATADSTASASRAPTPCTVVSSRNQSRSAASIKP